MRLSRERFAGARSYLMSRGRALERELFRVFLEECPRERALEALAGHQAANGGFFGMGEGDVEASTPVGTTGDSCDDLHARTSNGMRAEVRR